MLKSINVSCSRFGGTRNGVRVPARSSLCDAPPLRAEISQWWQLIGISVKAQDARSSEKLLSVYLQDRVMRSAPWCGAFSFCP